MSTPPLKPGVQEPAQTGVSQAAVPQTVASPVQRLLDRLGYQFRHVELLHQALTHPSVGQTGPAKKNRTGHRTTQYERLEFLGDRVLGLAIADLLFQTFGDEPEGYLARRHVALVRREALALVAVKIGLGEAINLSKGEESGGGRSNPSLLADACEAVIGAIYADAGYDVASRLVQHLWTPLMEQPITPPKDAKTALQEWAQGMGKALPLYRVLGQEGPAHEPVFKVEAVVEGLAPVIGSGSTKRAAEQHAAQSLLESIKA